MKKNYKKNVKTEIILVDKPGFYVDIDIDNKYYFVLINNKSKLETSDILEAAAFCVNNKEIPKELYNLNIIHDDNINILNTLKILSGGEEWDYGKWYSYEWSDVKDVFYKKYYSQIEKIYYICNTFGELVDLLSEKFNLEILLNFSLEKNFINKNIING